MNYEKINKALEVLKEFSSEEKEQFVLELHSSIPVEFENYVKSFLKDKHCFGGDSDILNWLHN